MEKNINISIWEPFLCNNAAIPGKKKRKKKKKSEKKKKILLYCFIVSLVFQYSVAICQTSLMFSRALTCLLSSLAAIMRAVSSFEV